MVKYSLVNEYFIVLTITMYNNENKRIVLLLSYISKLITNTLYIITNFNNTEPVKPIRAPQRAD